MIIPAMYRKKVEAVGMARVNGVLLAFFGPILIFPLTGPHSAHGMLWAIFSDFLLIVSVLFGIFILCVFLFDLLFVQTLNLLGSLTGYVPNKAIRDFEIASVAAIISFYGVIYCVLLLLSE